MRNDKLLEKLELIQRQIYIGPPGSTPIKSKWVKMPASVAHEFKELVDQVRDSIQNCVHYYVTDSISPGSKTATKVCLFCGDTYEKDVS